VLAFNLPEKSLMTMLLPPPFFS